MSQSTAVMFVAPEVRSLGTLRRLSLTSILVTVLAVGGCSSLGIGNGAHAIAEDPAMFLTTAGLLVGPLLVIEAVPLLLAWGRPSPTRATALVVVITTATLGAVATAYVAYILTDTTLHGLCTLDPNPNPAQQAACTAGGGSLAAFWGTVSAIGLPIAMELRRRAREGRVEPGRPDDT